MFFYNDYIFSSKLCLSCIKLFSFYSIYKKKCVPKIQYECKLKYIYCLCLDNSKCHSDIITLRSKRHTIKQATKVDHFIPRLDWISNLNALIMGFTLPYICNLEFIEYNEVIIEEDLMSARPLYVMQP